MTYFASRNDSCHAYWIKSIHTDTNIECGHHYREYGHQDREHALYWFSEEIDDIYHVIVQVFASKLLRTVKAIVRHVCVPVYMYIPAKRERERAPVRERDVKNVNHARSLAWELSREQK